MKRFIPYSLVGLGFVMLLGCAPEVFFTPNEGPKPILIEQVSSAFVERTVFSYGSNGEVLTADRGGPQPFAYEYVYEGARLMAMHRLRYEDSARWVDSLVYDNFDQLIKVSNYRIREDEGVTLGRYVTYRYDRQGRVLSQRQYSAGPDGFSMLLMYTWEEGEIVKVQYFGEEDDLRYEDFITYDDRPNYRKAVPGVFYSPVLWGDHNVTEIRWVDHYGNLDRFCKPCTTTLTYNEEGYPTVAEYNSGLTEKITYLE